MTNMIDVGGLEAGPFALRMNALRGTATYAAYLAAPDDVDLALTEIEEEFRGFDPGAQITRISPRGAKELVAALAAESDEILLIDARSFSADDWALLDRRRSAIAHRGVTVFVTMQSSFDDLMRVAPILRAGWVARCSCFHPTMKLALLLTVSGGWPPFAHGHHGPTRRSSRRPVRVRCHPIPNMLSGSCCLVTESCWTRARHELAGYSALRRRAQA